MQVWSALHQAAHGALMCVKSLLVLFSFAYLLKDVYCLVGSCHPTIVVNIVPKKV